MSVHISVHMFIHISGWDPLSYRLWQVLVHCSAGMSRSAAFVLAFLIYRRDMHLADALRLLKTKRHLVKQPPCRRLAFPLKTLQHPSTRRH